MQNDDDAKIKNILDYFSMLLFIFRPHLLRQFLAQHLPRRRGTLRPLGAEEQNQEQGTEKNIYRINFHHHIYK